MTKFNKILVLLLIAQLGVLVLSKAVFRGDELAKPEKLFPQLKSDDVSLIEVIDGEKKRAVLEKRGEDWVLKSGGDYPVKKDKVKEFLAKLPGLTSVEQVTSKPSHYRSLEVHNDKFQRDITIKAGDKSHRFLIGSSPGIKSVHLRFKDQDTVHLVKDLSAWDVGTAATTWVDSTFFKVNKQDVVNVRLKNSHGEIQLAKGSAGKWTIAGVPPHAQFDEGAINAFLGQATSVLLQKPVGSQSDPAQGFGSPLAQLTLITEEKPQKPPTEPQKKAAQPAEVKPIPPGASQPAGQGEDSENEPAENKSAENKPVNGSPPANEAQTTAESTSAPPPPPIRKTHVLTIGTKGSDKDSGSYYATSSQSKFVALIASWSAEQFVNKKLKDFIKEPQKDEKNNDKNK